jgi:zinc/manganese transport system substrate-binding protein
MRKLILALALLLGAPLSAAALEVAATTPNMGMLARTVGGEHVNVVGAGAGRPRRPLPRGPAQHDGRAAARRPAGRGRRELEVGWLPAAIQGAGQSAPPAGPARLLRGGRGRDAARCEGLRPTGRWATSTRGQPAHLLRSAAHGRRGRGAGRAPRGTRCRQRGSASANAEAFRRAHGARGRRGWRARVAGGPGALLYHKDADYLMERLGCRCSATSSRCRASRRRPATSTTSSASSRAADGVILHMVYEPARGPRRLG